MTATHGDRSPTADPGRNERLLPGAAVCERVASVGTRAGCLARRSGAMATTTSTSVERRARDLGRPRLRRRQLSSDRRRRRRQRGRWFGDVVIRGDGARKPSGADGRCDIHRCHPDVPPQGIAAPDDAVDVRRRTRARAAAGDAQRQRRRYLRPLRILTRDLAHALGDRPARSEATPGSRRHRLAGPRRRIDRTRCLAGDP